MGGAVLNIFYLALCRISWSDSSCYLAFRFHWPRGCDCLCSLCLFALFAGASIVPRLQNHTSETCPDKCLFESVHPRVGRPPFPFLALGRFGGSELVLCMSEKLGISSVQQF